MLSACSPWVLESSAISVFNVPSSFNNSCLRSAFTESAPPIFASISLMVFSIMVWSKLTRSFKSGKQNQRDPDRWARPGFFHRSGTGGTPVPLPASDFGQDGPDEIPDFGGDTFDRAGGFHQANAFGLGGGDDGKTFFHALEKLPVGLLDAVAHEGQGGLAHRAAKLADLRRDREQQRQIRPRVTDGNVYDRLDHRQSQFAAVALIRGRGIVKAVTHNDFAGLERRTDD